MDLNTMAIISSMISLIVISLVGMWLVRRVDETKRLNLRLKHEKDIEEARQRPFITSEDHVDVSVQINEFGDLTAVSMKGSRKSMAQIKSFVESLQAPRQTMLDLDGLDAQEQIPEETKKRSKR